VEAGAGKRLCKRYIRGRAGPQRLGNYRRGLFDGRGNASGLAKPVMIEPAEKQRPDHVTRLAPLDEL
jgi:hypothetical protein